MGQKNVRFIRRNGRIIPIVVGVASAGTAVVGAAKVHQGTKEFVRGTGTASRAFQEAAKVGMASGRYAPFKRIAQGGARAAIKGAAKIRMGIGLTAIGAAGGLYSALALRKKKNVR